MVSVVDIIQRFFHGFRRWFLFYGFRRGRERFLLFPSLVCFNGFRRGGKICLFCFMVSVLAIASEG